MKINYVLLEDVKCKRREAREALEARTQNKNIQVGESMIGREPAQPPVGRMISEAELGLMNEIVKQSGYFERNKTRDVHQDLIREFIRLELSLLDTLSFSLSLCQTGGVPGASHQHRDGGAEVCAEQEGDGVC